LSNIDWFQLIFEKLIENVSEYPSWRSFLNVLNCTCIISDACNNYLTGSEINELKSRMKDVSEKFINRKFRRFIENDGNWEALENYKNLIAHNQSKVDQHIIATVLCITAGAFVALVLLLRR